MFKKTITILLIISCLSLISCNQPPANKQTGKPIIKVGAVFPYTGEYASYGEAVRKGIDLAVEKVNQENNLQLEVIHEDSQLDPQKAVSAAKKLINLDKVSFILSFSSGETLAICPVVENTKTVLLTSCSSPDVTSKCGDYTFRNYPSDIYQGKELASRVYAQGYKKVAILYINNQYGVGLKDEFDKNFQGNILTVQSHEPKRKDFRTQLNKIKETRADAIVLITFIAEVGNILKQKNELNIAQPVFSSESLKTDELFAQVEANLLDKFHTIFVSQYTGAEHQKFETSHIKKYNQEPGFYADYYYDNVLALANALDRCPQKSAECVKSKMYSTNFIGATGAISYDPNGDIAYKPYSLYKVENKEFVLVE